MSHTPGPWYANGDCIEADGPEGPRDVTVATVTGSLNPLADNARLIAAAPQLLEFLKEASMFVNNYTPFGGVAAKYRDLIEHVEGR